MTRRAAAELDEILGGTELRAFRLDGAGRDLFLLFRDRTLIWRLHPTRGHLLVRPPTPPGPSDLRHAARVRRVSAPPDERVVKIELMPKRNGPPRDVFIELLGNQWNALVVEVGSGTVRHVLWSRETRRGHRVGAEYRLPGGQPREGVDTGLSLRRWLQLLEDVPTDERQRTLVRSIAWTSPLNAAAFLGDDVTGDARVRLTAGYERWLAAVTEAAGEDGAGAAVVLELEHGLHPYPLPLPGTPSRPAPGLLDAFDQAVRDGPESGADTPSLLDPELFRRLERAADQARRRVTQLVSELDGLPDADAARAVGDLILARYGDVPRGVSQAVLTDFQGSAVRVDLDPTLEPNENAARYYDRATRIERAHRRLPGLIEKARGESAALERLLAGAREGSIGVEDVREVLPEERAAPGGSSSEAATLPYRTFRSSGGLEIRVGRGARHNDDLTFRHSSPGDVWLHARHAAGAHVILRWTGPGNPPGRDLTEAATLAALHSKARTSGSVPVDWTFRKYVRKPRGAPRGAVVPDRVSTLFVRPDPGLERSLDEA